MNYQNCVYYTILGLCRIDVACLGHRTIVNENVNSSRYFISNIVMACLHSTHTDSTDILQAQ